MGGRCMGGGDHGSAFKRAAACASSVLIRGEYCVLHGSSASIRLLVLRYDAAYNTCCALIV